MQPARLLFLTSSYPDFRKSATMLCTHRVMECIAQSGRYEVHALCMRYGGEPALEHVNGITVHRFRPSLWTRMRFVFAGHNACPRLNRFCELLQKIITIPAFPVSRPLTALYYLCAAKRLQRTEKFKYVISEHHEVESLLTGCRLKRKFGLLKHVALLWDPVQGQIPTVHLPKKYSERRIRAMERFSANYSTLLVSTVSMRDFYLAHGDIAADHRVYMDIPGIIPPDPEIPSEYLSLLKKDRINMVYSGSLSELQRNPMPLISLLNRCKYSERINIIFFSRGADEAIRQAARSFRGTIVCHDYIPLNELHTVYHHADYLLNVSHVNANMVPSKIFEYMSYGKPIISTYVTQGDSAQKYLARYREGLCIDLNNPEEENISAIDAFLSVNHAPVPFEEIKQQFKDNSPESFLSLLTESPEERRVLVIHPTIAPYRLDFFNDLYRLCGARICLLYWNLKSQSFNYDELYRQFAFKPEYLEGNYLMAVRRIIRDYRPDIVMTSEYGRITFYSLLLSILPGFRHKTVALSDDNYDMVSGGNDFSFAHRLARRICVPFLADVVLPDARVVDLYKKKYRKGFFFPIVTDEKLASSRYERLLPLSRDMAERYNLAGQKVLLSVSRLVELKNLPRVIEAFGRIKEDATLVVVGDGPEKEHLMELAQSCEKKIIFTGRLEGDELYAWYNIACVLVLASYKEAFGAVTNEALQAGCRAVVSNKAGSSCLIDNTNGELVDPLDVEQISAALDRQLGLTAVPTLGELRPDRMPFRYQDLMTALTTHIMEI